MALKCIVAGLILVFSLLVGWQYYQGEGPGRDGMPVAPRSAGDRLGEDVGRPLASTLDLETSPSVLLRENAAGDESPRLADAGDRVVLEPSAQAARLTASVVDSDGAPIADAWISLTPTSASRFGRSLERDHAATLEASLQARTDSGGRFRLQLDRSPGTVQDLEAPGVLWITHPEHAPACFELVSVQDLPEVIALRRTGPLEVRVTDPQGRPVSGAEVLTFLTDSPTVEAAASLSRAAHAAFVRSTTSDERGIAILPQGIGEQHAIARAGKLVSAPWYGRAPAELRLVLGGAVRVSGHVRLLPGAEGGGLFVTALSSSPVIARALGRATVSEGGRYGPIEIAHDEDAQLVLRVEGSGIQPQEKSMAFPPSGGHVSVDFEPLQGLDVQVRVLEPGGEPVVLAEVRPWWQVDDQWHQASGRTDAEGLATVSLRPGEVWLQCGRPGFVEVMLGPQTVLEVPTDPLEIILTRAGSIRGRVLRGEEPVSTFQVRYWGESSGSRGGHAVLDSADGSFLLEEVPLGEISLCAIQAGYPPSALVQTTVVWGTQNDLVLRLPPAHSCTGTLVDAYSSRPIPDAVVQTWVVEDNLWRIPTGVGSLTDARGRFELTGLAPGLNHLLFEAPGYARLQRAVLVEVGEGASMDLGPFALAPVGDLTVVLRAPASVDPTRCRVQLTNSPGGQAQAFTAEGVAIFTAQQAGTVSLTVSLPSGGRVNHSEFLRAGQPWSIEVSIEDEAARGVEVLLQDWEQFEEGLSIFASTSFGEGQRSERQVPLIEGRALVPGPLGAALWLELVQGRDRVLLARHFAQEEWSSGRILLRAAQERRTFLVMDRQSQPLRGVTVMLTVSPDTGWMSWGSTDSSGRVDLAVPPNPDVYVQLRAPDAGGLVDRALEVPSDAEREIVLVVDPDSRLEVRFQDRGVPLPGVRSFLVAPSGLGYLVVGWADTAGRADSGAIGSGAYVLKVDASDLWPLRLPLEVQPGENQRTVELRRIGGLVLTARRPGGAGLAGAAVSLRSLEFGEDVAEWIAQGRVHAPAGDLRTDGEGHLRVTGLPNGAYRFTIRGEDGRTASGEITVPPHGEGRAEVTLAPH